MKRTGRKCRKVNLIKILIFVITLLFCAGCTAGSRGKVTEAEILESTWEDEITIMHVDAGDAKFEDFIEQAEKNLHMKINVLEYPSNADARHAKISSLLAAGDISVDVFAVNDEMINSFKYEGYLEPLEGDVMAPETTAVFPQEYLYGTVMENGHIYSAPYVLDILTLWINEEWVKEAGITDVSSREDFYHFLSYDWGEGRYAYGGAWEEKYVFNELGEFINIYGGDYNDWKNEKNRQSVQFLKECIDLGYTSKEQMIDQYEQMIQKFIDGKYGMVFAYSNSVDLFYDADVYGEDKIHMTALPDLGENVTYMSTWQYALNKASVRKEAAKRFMSYAVSKEGSRVYAECMNRIPARSDLFREKDLNILGYEQFQDYLKKVELKARPIPSDSIIYLEKVGRLFQQYVIGELEIDVYCSKMQNLVEQYVK